MGMINLTLINPATATVADGSITAVKIADGAVTINKIAGNSVSHDKLTANTLSVILNSRG